MAKKSTPTVETMRVKLSTIVDNPANARKDLTSPDALDGIKRLAADIKENGLTHPPTVIRTGNAKKPYQIVAGSRRFAALQLLDKDGETDVRITSLKQEDGADLELLGLSENLDREDISPYEAAVKFHELKTAYGIEGAYMARRVGKSVNLVNNYIRVISNVHPKIVEQWKVGNPLCTTDNLLKLAGVKNESTGEPDHQAQWERWMVMTGANVAAGQGDVDAGEEGEDNAIERTEVEKRQPKRAAQDLIALILGQKGKDDKGWLPAVQCLQYCLGVRKTLPVGLAKAAEGE